MSILQEQKFTNATDVDFAGAKIYPVFCRAFILTTEFSSRALSLRHKKTAQKEAVIYMARETHILCI
jgi:hypothetical protein